MKKYKQKMNKHLIKFQYYCPDCEGSVRVKQRVVMATKRVVPHSEIKRMRGKINITVLIAALGYLCAFVGMIIFIVAVIMILIDK